MTLLALPFRIRRRRPRRLPPFAKTPIPGRAGRLLDASRRRTDPAIQRDLGKVTGGHAQAPHAGGGGEAARLRAPHPARLGARRPLLPDLLRRTPRRAKPATRNSCAIPDSATFVPLDQPQRLADGDRASLRLRLSTLANNCSQNPQSAAFSSDWGVNLHQTPLHRTESHVQADLRPGPAASTMAQQLDEAFAGCDEWTIAPPVQRRSTLDFSPRTSELVEDPRQSRRGAHPGVARAVVVGVVQEDDVPGRGCRRSPCARSTPASPAASSPVPTATTAPAASRGADRRAARRR